MEAAKVRANESITKTINAEKEWKAYPKVDALDQYVYVIKLKEVINFIYN